MTDTTRVERITNAAREAAELALLSITISDIEERVFRYTSVPPSIAELRHAANLIHNATIVFPDEDTEENTPS